jgi:hypothetical protein
MSLEKDGALLFFLLSLWITEMMLWIKIHDQKKSTRKLWEVVCVHLVAARSDVNAIVSK